MTELRARERILFDSVIATEQTVNVAGLNHSALAFMQRLGLSHEALFGLPLAITSAKDGRHAAGSLHAEGKAFDYRTLDKSNEQNAIFLAVVAFLSQYYHCTVFDERNLLWVPHVHIEYPGE